MSDDNMPRDRKKGEPLPLPEVKGDKPEHDEEPSSQDDQPQVPLMSVDGGTFQEVSLPEVAGSLLSGGEFHFEDGGTDSEVKTEPQAQDDSGMQDMLRELLDETRITNQLMTEMVQLMTFGTQSDQSQEGWG